MESGTPSPGLASTMVYGKGDGNTVKHYYAGSKKPLDNKKKNQKGKGK